MWNFNLLQATRAVEKTMPFVLFRWLMYLGVAGGLLFATLGGAGTAIGLSSLSSNPTLFANLGAIAGFAGFLWAYHKLRRTLFYHVDGPHLLLLAKIASGEVLPQGKAQIDYSKQLMSKIFPSSSGLFALQRNVAEAFAALPRLLAPGLVNHAQPQIATALGALYAWIGSLNSDVVIARISSTPTQQDFAAVAEVERAAGAQALLLRNRLSLIAVEFIGLVLSYAVLLVPSKSIAAMLPADTGIWPYVFALVFAWNIKASFLVPISQAAMLQVFGNLPESQPDTMQSLDTIDAIRRLRHTADSP